MDVLSGLSQPFPNSKMRAGIGWRSAWTVIVPERFFYVFLIDLPSAATQPETPSVPAAIRIR